MVEKLKEQIKRGNKLLLELKDLPSSWRYNYSENDPFEEIKNKIENWQKFIIILLKSRFKEDQSEMVSEFEKTVYRTKMKGSNNEYSSEVRSGINCLESLIERLPIINDMTEINSNPTTERKSPKVFISHSSKDLAFARSLVDLLEFLGINSSELMMCSSVVGYNIPLGTNIFDYLREQFLSYDLFVIFIHSPNYYESPISLNEMGAAWALKTKHCSFLTPCFNYDEMKGVVNNQEIAIKVDEDNAFSSLNDLKGQLLSFFNLKDKDQSRWEKKKNAFLEEVRVNSVKETVSSNENQFSYNFSKKTKGSGILSFINEGRNIEDIIFDFDLKENDLCFLTEKKTRKSLQANGKVKFKVTLFETTPDDCYVTIRWKDAGHEKEEKLNISLV